MAGTKRSKAGDVIFEGVVIPRRTRSAKIAAQGIANEEDMARFLTAIFADTLNGKIVLPKPDSANGPERISNGAEQKLNRGLPVTIKAKPKKKRTPKPND